MRRDGAEWLTRRESFLRPEFPAAGGSGPGSGVTDCTCSGSRAVIPIFAIVDSLTVVQEREELNDVLAPPILACQHQSV